MPDAPYSAHSARIFAEKYAGAASEKQLGQSFWRDFFHEVVGMADLMAAGIEFEHPVKSHSTGTTNFVDVLWPGVVLIEHKSAGKNLDVAEVQARDYLVSLSPERRAPVVVVSDFKRIRIVDTLKGDSVEFSLADLPSHLHRFQAIVGKHKDAALRPEIEADEKAVKLMTDLFVEFESAGYDGHEASVFLIRLLFLNFGDDTRMWKRKGRGLFASLVAQSPENGSGLGAQIQELFQVLATPIKDRPTSLSPDLVDFPWVNGGLFKEPLRIFAFTPEMRAALIATTDYDWSKISPAIFGSLFQTVKDKELRRQGGEHYTSEANILKVIRPLFLDSLIEQVHKHWTNAPQLKRIRTQLAKNQYLDPACGSGNFLVVAYKRLRELELKIIVRLQDLGEHSTQLALTDGTHGLAVHLAQFHGIEIEEWSSQIATVAMYLADHQANLELEEITGASPDRFPLIESAGIHHANALELDWAQVVEFDANTYVMGNPPFYGAREQSAPQKANTLKVWENAKNAGELDFVSSWFLLASRKIHSSGCKAGLVATNSITQGEQPSIMWPALYELGIGIDFAHRSFKWKNETKNAAAVHAVVIGFSATNRQSKVPLWTYAHAIDEPDLVPASNINAYLADAPNILVSARSAPLNPTAAKMDFGSMPNDGGLLSKISAEEAAEIRATDPTAAKYLRRLIGAKEFINNRERYCLWLVGAEPADIRSSTVLSERVAAVKQLRSMSKRTATKRLADRAAEFGEIRQPTTDYIVVPCHTSEAREYVPMAMMPPEVITNNAVLLVPDPKLLTFGWLQSRPFNIWNKAVSGRIKSDTRISNTITYNNFPLPDPIDKQRKAIEDAAQAVLDARVVYPSSSLADLYDPTAMPALLRAAHRTLDKATLAALGLKVDATDEKVLSKLFSLYDDATRGLLPATKKRPARA